MLQAVVEEMGHEYKALSQGAKCGEEEEKEHVEVKIALGCKPYRPRDYLRG